MLIVYHIGDFSQHGLFSHLYNSIFGATKVFNYDEVQFINIFSIYHAFGVIFGIFFKCLLPL